MVSEVMSMLMVSVVLIITPSICAAFSPYAPGVVANAYKRSDEILLPDGIETDTNVSFDAKMGYYVECDTYEDAEKETKKCYLNEERSTGSEPNYPGCYTVWDETRGLMRQGCYVNQQSNINEQCTDSKCGSYSGMGTIHHCCCRGHKCNANYYVRTESEKGF